jgi:hypothetical protein
MQRQYKNIKINSNIKILKLTPNIKISEFILLFISL